MVSLYINDRKTPIICHVRIVGKKKCKIVFSLKTTLANNLFLPTYPLFFLETNIQIRERKKDSNIKVYHNST